MDRTLAELKARIQESEKCIEATLREASEALDRVPPAHRDKNWRYLRAEINRLTLKEATCTRKATYTAP